MKHLYESIFDDDSILNTADDIIKKNIYNFIETNYYAKGLNGTLSWVRGDYKLIYNDSLGKFIVDSDKSIMVKQISKYKLINLTNEYFEWGKVKSFDCTDCIELISLEGAPKKVKDTFDCSHCVKIKSLEGAPEEVSNFYCMNCDSLETLKGGPKKVQIFICSFCKSLKSLKGGPDIVKNYLSCAYCEKMKKLDWIPKKIKSLVLGLSNTNIPEKEINDFKKQTNAEIV